MATGVVGGRARAAGATHLVLCATERCRGLRRLTDRALADQVLERMPELEVHTVAARPATPPREG